MTKAEFVSRVAEKAGISRDAAARAVDAMLDPEPRLSRRNVSAWAKYIKRFGTRLEPVSDPAAVSEIRELALSVWENPQDAEEFLMTPHALLNDQPPLEVARTPAGAARVREILLALEYGLPV